MKHSGINSAAILMAAALALVSCEETISPIKDDMVFEAWTANTSDATKVYLDAAHMVYWTASDRLSVFRSATDEEYEFDGETGDDYGTFSKVDESVKAASYSRNYALYPYSATATCAESGLMTFVFPEVQTYAVKSPGLGANMMVAATSGPEDNQFRFRNLCGYIVLKITGDVSIKNIVLQGNDNEILSGAATAQIVYLNSPSVVVGTEGGKTVTLDCGTGVALDKVTPTEFWFAIPGTSFTNGFKISVTTTSEGWFTKTTTRSMAISRNEITPMAAFNISKLDIDNQLEIPVDGGEIEW